MAFEVLGRLHSVSNRILFKILHIPTIMMDGVIYRHQGVFLPNHPAAAGPDLYGGRPGARPPPP